MDFVAILDAEPGGRVAKFKTFPTLPEAATHVANLIGMFPDGFVVAEPAGPWSHWLINMAAKTITIDPPPPPAPIATGAQMIDQAESQNKLDMLTAALTPSEMAIFVTRRRIVAGSSFAEVLRSKLGISAPVMASFIATASGRTEA